MTLQAPLDERNPTPALSAGPVEPLPAAPRILAIRLSAMGDVLLTFPAVQALRRQYPRARITYLTDRRFAGLLDGLPAIDARLVIDRRGLGRRHAAAWRGLWRDLRTLVTERFDCVTDFHSFFETGLLSVLSGARVRVGRQYKTRATALYHPWIAVPHPPEYVAAGHLDTLVRAALLPPTALDAWRSQAPPAPFFFPPAAATKRVAAWLAEHDLDAGQPLVALFAGASNPQKRWPPERFARLCARLDKARTTEPALAASLGDAPPVFLVLRGLGEHALTDSLLARARALGLDAPRLRATPVFTPPEIGALVARCRLLVSNDSGPMHLGVAVGTPTVGLFRYPPDWGKRVGERPCFLVPPPHVALEAPAGGLPVLAVETVADAATRLLAASPD